MLSVPLRLWYYAVRQFDSPRRPRARLKSDVQSRYHCLFAYISHFTCLVTSKLDPTITDPFATATVIEYFILASPKDLRSRALQ